jgi:hydroxymethylbilane synthase
MADGSDNRLRVGTRGSLLARTQTEGVVERLQNLHPDLDVEIHIIQTTGDLRRDMPFAAVGTKGMFVKEIEQALLDGVIDIGVHSLKDMPGELPDGLELACIPRREDPLDALLSRDGSGLDELPGGAVVGTSSLRRQAQLRAYRPDFRLQELRGNLDTRLRKLEEGQYDAIVLACAGLKRLGLEGRITERLEPTVSVPAAGQGALALETRVGDTETRTLLAPLHDTDTADAVSAERAFLAALGGGCTVPAGALATVLQEALRLLAVAAAPDGALLLREEGRASRGEAANLGRAVAERLLERGGRDLLKG